MAAGRDLESGVFLFTDIEGSSELRRQLGAEPHDAVLTDHARVLRAVVEAHGGRVVEIESDSLLGAFSSAREAVTAAVEGQRELAARDWPDQQPVRVRMGLHDGAREATWVGTAAHGGQILVSEATRALVSDDLPAGMTLRALGPHRLRDDDDPVPLYPVVAADLDDRFPPPRRLLHRRRARLVPALTAGVRKLLP